jgi:hypothetical protein
VRKIPFPETRAPQKREWVNVRENPQEQYDMYNFRVIFDRELTDEEISLASRCIGYSFAKNVRGEGLSDPTIQRMEQPTAMTILDFGYDMTKSPRDDVSDCFPDVWDDARTFVIEGTPQRKTQGYTRQTEGIGRVGMEFFVEGARKPTQYYHSAGLVDSDGIFAASNTRLVFWTSDKIPFKVDDRLSLVISNPGLNGLLVFKIDAANEPYDK